MVTTNFRVFRAQSW